MKRQSKLTRKQLKLELESLLHTVGVMSDSATIEDDLVTLRVVLEYMRFDQEACGREIKYLQGLNK